jgi:hypothetical protein
LVNKMKKLFTLVTLGVLLVALARVGFVSWSNRAMAVDVSGGETVNTATEFCNGTIGSPSDPLVVWYVWINTSGFQVIYMACLSYLYPPPIVTFFGEHYWTQNGTEMFVGNTLTAMEVYNDTNGNGVPDVNTGNGTSELLYNYGVNSSQGFVMTPLEKTVVGGVSHYTWGLRYDTVDGFLLTGNEVTCARVMLDYFGSSFDFYVQDNVSYLKTGFEMGNVLNVTSVPGFEVTLDGLSLSLLYGTTVDASKSYTAVVNGEPYNSTTTQNLTEPTGSGEIRVGDARAFQCVFGQNYTLFRDSQAVVCSSQSAAVSDQSVFGGLHRSVEFALSFFEQLLSGLFPKISNLPATVDLDYNVSSLLYRVCYPQWGGCALEHDPTYIAYLTPNIAHSAPTAVPGVGLGSPPVGFVAVAAVVGSVALVVALRDVRKTRRTPWSIRRLLMFEEANDDLPSRAPPLFYHPLPKRSET